MGDKTLIKTAKLQSHPANAAVIAMLDDYAREEAAMGRAKLAQTARKALYQIRRHAFPNRDRETSSLYKIRWSVYREEDNGSGRCWKDSTREGSGCGEMGGS